MYLKERSRGRNNKDLQVKEHFRVRIASPFGRLGPLATQMSTGHLRFTLVHFRVLIASAALTKGAVAQSAE